MSLPFCSKNKNHSAFMFNAKEEGIPFHCDICGVLEFPLRAIRDILFVWPDPLPKFIGNEKIIEIPLQFREFYKNEFGYVLSIGPGYYDNKHFIHTDRNIVPGSRIVYDKTIPWTWEVQDSKGISHVVKVFGARDVLAICDETDSNTV